MTPGPIVVCIRAVLPRERWSRGSSRVVRRGRRRAHLLGVGGGSAGRQRFGALLPRRGVGAGRGPGAVPLEGGPLLLPAGRQRGGCRTRTFPAPGDPLLEPSAGGGGTAGRGRRRPCRR